MDYNNNYNHSNGGRNGSSNVTNNNGPRSKCDQVIFEAVCKACEIIVSSRSSSHIHNNHIHNTTQQRFNLQVPEIAQVRQILGNFKSSSNVTGLLPTIRVDVYYQHEANDVNNNAKSDSSDTHADTRQQKQSESSSQRELLERWCLSYTPQTMAKFLHLEGAQMLTNNTNNSSSDDAIVQLRHVCKRMVIWLRTLYCQTRWMGAHKLQGNPRVGFSVYPAPLLSSSNADLHSEAAADEQSLIQQQAFVTVHNVSSVVTPYGELSWKVTHAPTSAITRLVIPKHIPNRIPSRNITYSATTSSRPIPIQQGYTTTTNNSQRVSSRRNHASQRHVALSAPVSAGPARASSMPRRGIMGTLQQQQQQTTSLKGLIPPSQQHSQLQQQHQVQYQQPQLARTFDARHHYQRSHTSEEVEFDEHHHHLDTNNGPNLLQQTREYSAPLNDSDFAKNGTTNSNNNNNTKKPARVLSGLSLALLSVDDDDKNNDAKQQRRAALHQLPPAATAEYGYGYNNHIAWQAIHPSQSNPTTVPRRRESLNDDATTTSATGSHNSHANYNTINSLAPNNTSSPYALASTPPTAAFLGSTPPTIQMHHHHHHQPNSTPVSTAGLIPPIKQAVTPPFVRPVGFCQDAAVTSSPKMPVLGSAGGHTTTPEPKTPLLQLNTAASSDDEKYLAPPPSLDLLPSNPFGSSSQHMMAGSQSALQLPNNNMLSSILMSTDATGGRGGSHSPIEEMPFAVDIDSIADNSENMVSKSGISSSPAAATENSSSLSLLLANSNSAAVASFAQQCQSSQRLQLFESLNNSNNSNNGANSSGNGNNASASNINNNTSSQQHHHALVEDQLSEFASFGASLMLNGSVGGHAGGSETSSVHSTPQPA